MKCCQHRWHGCQLGPRGLLEGPFVFLARRSQHEIPGPPSSQVQGVAKFQSVFNETMWKGQPAHLIFHWVMQLNLGFWEGLYHPDHIFH